MAREGFRALAYTSSSPPPSSAPLQDALSRSALKSTFGPLANLRSQ